MASDINTGTAPCSNTAAAIDCLSPLVAIRLCGSLETAQPMLNTTLAIHLTSKKVDAFAFVTHRLIQGYRFRVGPYRFCGASNPTTHSILLWSYLILSDAHIINIDPSDTHPPKCWSFSLSRSPSPKESLSFTQNLRELSRIEWSTPSTPKKISENQFHIL